MSDEVKVIGITEATIIVQEHFRKICSGFLSFAVLAAVDDKTIPFIALRIKEHCLMEPDFRVHDVFVNRDGTIHHHRCIGIDGKDSFSALTGR